MGLVVCLLVVYFVVWCWLLSRWLKTKEYYPIAGPGWKTRVFWGISFIFFNPLLSLLFFLFGVCLKNKGEKPKHLVAMRLTCLPLVALIIIIFELPIGIPRAQPKQWTQSVQPPLAGEMTLVGNSAAKVSMGGGYGWLGYHRFDPSHVAIITHGDHPFLTYLGHALAAHYSALPSVKSVSFYPNNKGAEKATAMPSLFIELRDKAIHELPLPAGLMLDANIEVTIKSSQYSTSRWTPLPVARTSTQASIHEKFMLFGIASPATKYKRIATTLTNALGLSLGSTLYPWWQFEVMPPIPAYMYGKGGRAPNELVPSATPQLHLRGGQLLIHDMAFWELAHNEDLAPLKADFISKGWVVKKSSSDYLRLTRDNEELIIKSENAPLEVLYLNRFTAEEIDHALERLLADPDVEEGTLLFFGHYLRNSEREDLFQAYHARIARVAPNSFPIAFERARVHDRAGEREQTQAMLAVASAHERLLTTPQGGWDLTRFAERMGLAIPDEETINLSLAKSLAVTPRAKRGEDIVLKIPADQAFRFHIDGEDDASPNYFTARLAELMWPMTPTAGGVHYGEPLNAIGVTEKRGDGGTSFYFSVCAEKADLLATQTMNIHLNTISPWILTAKKTATDEIEWRLAPAE